MDEEKRAQDPYLSELDELGESGSLTEDSSQDFSGGETGMEDIEEEHTPILGKTGDSFDFSHSGVSADEEAPTSVNIPTPKTTRPTPPPVFAQEAPSQTHAVSSEKNTFGLHFAPDIPVQMVVVMGRKNVTVGDLMEMKTGQVIEMDKVPGDTFDLVVGGRIVAKGELVNVDGKLGLRILKLLK